MLNGNGYSLEEEMLCGHKPWEGEQDRARAAIDDAMAIHPVDALIDLGASLAPAEEAQARSICDEPVTFPNMGIAHMTVNASDIASKQFMVRHGDNRTVANKLREWASAIEAEERPCGMVVDRVIQSESGVVFNISIVTPAGVILP